MERPERLEDDARPARRTSRVLVGVVLLVVAGLGAARLTGLTPDRSPSTSPGPTSTSTPPPGWPQGVGTGTLYVVDGDGIASLDVATGLVQRSPIKVDPSSVTITGAGLGVLVWFFSGAGTPHLVTAGSPTTPTVGPVLAAGQQFLPGPGTAVWTTNDEEGSDRRTSSWRLVDVDGTVLDSRRLEGAEGDGSGGLLAVGDREVRHVVSGEDDVVWRGGVGAVGPDGFEALHCDADRCAPVLHDRVTGAETAIPVVTVANPAALSPGNRFAASVEGASAPDGEALVVRVSQVGDGRTLRSLPGEGPLVWLSERWLATTGEQGLVLYDAVADQVVTPSVRLAVPTRLVLRPA